MNILLAIIISAVMITVLVIGSMFITNQQNDDDLEYVDYYSFDIKNYLGTWYSVYEKPIYYGFKNFGYSSTDCTDTKATYTMNTDGTIEVFNSCVEETEEGGILRTVGGTARQIDGGKLEVSFFYEIWSDYQIIYLDENYQYALVGTPSHTGLWFLSRTTDIPKDIYTGMTLVAQDNGFDTSDVYKVRSSV